MHQQQGKGHQPETGQFGHDALPFPRRPQHAQNQVQAGDMQGHRGQCQAQSEEKMLKHGGEPG